MEIRNSIEQETQNRHAGLFSELLAVLYQHSDPFGHQWVEVVGSQEIRLHSRYVAEGRTYSLTQTVSLEVRAVPIHEAPTSSSAAVVA